MGLGVPELLIILAIVLVLFGAKRLPELGRSLGGGMREFKDSVTRRGEDDEDDDQAPAALPEAAAPPVAEAPQPAAAESDSAAQPRT